MTAKTLAVELPPEIFDVQVNIPLIHQVVVAQQAAARRGTSDTKTRGEVRGGGRKPYRQKGTGRARQGSTRAPQFAGGGTVHGPTPRSYTQRTPKKMKATALRGALSDRARAGRVHVVDAFVTGDTPSTKAAVSALAGIAGSDRDRSRTLVVLDRGDGLTWLSLRNVDSVHLLAVDQLNTYDVLCCDDVVFTRQAFDAFVGGDSAAEAQPVTQAVPAVAAETPDALEPDEAAGGSAASVESDDYPGSARPLPDGSAPAGYRIKGNTSSMKFHAPGGRWYDATTAEVWFKSTDDAAAAGFTEAGKKATDPATEEAQEEDT